MNKTTSYDVKYIENGDNYLIDIYDIKIPKDFVDGLMGSFIKDDKYIIEFNSNNNDLITITSLDNCLECVPNLFLEIRVKDLKKHSNEQFDDNTKTTKSKKNFILNIFR